jgi:hypothetical protein
VAHSRFDECRMSGICSQKATLYCLLLFDFVCSDWFCMRYFGLELVVRKLAMLCGLCTLIFGVFCNSFKMLWGF